MRRAHPITRLYILAGIILLALGGVVLRLYYVQIARGEEYTKKIRSSSQVTVRIPAVRGEILDRNGIPLVQNRASFEVDFYLPEMVRAYRQTKGAVPKTSYRAVVHGMLTNKEEPDVVRIVGEEVIPRLEQLGLAQDFNSSRMQAHYRNETEVPFNYRQDLDFETMAKFSENNVGLPGVNVTVKPVRQYLYGAMAAHLLGYVGAPNEVDKEEAAKYKFFQPDVEGKAQIELYMNEYLKGTPGVRILQRNAKGVIDGEVGMIEPKQGNNVYLTLDARIQYIAEQALRSVGRGAAVVMDPNSGDILAMASVPSYDPNKFIPSISAADWAFLRDDETDPLLNRTISSFAPGSTFKLVTSLAGIRAGIGNKTFTCSGGVQYGNKYMGCWTIQKHLPPHGTLGLSDALKHSCNAFFYQYGNAAGIEQIDAVGNMLGLGQKTGIPLTGESPGVLPGPQWLAAVNPRERWSQGYTASVSIGQGSVLASPLQMALVASAVANGGISYYPRLIDKVVSQDGKVVLQESAKVHADLTKEGGFTQEQLDLVRKGMWKVVNDSGGTGGKARLKDIEVAGKTGTAQNWVIRDGKKVQDNHVWFVSFAPYDKPRYVVVVLVQNGKSGGGVAAPIAAKILEDTFKLDKGEAPTLAALEPAYGNTQFIDSIDFGREVPAVSTDEETVEPSAADDQKVAPKKDEAPEPNIRPDADERGRVQNQPKPKTGLEKFFNFLGGKRDKKAAPPQ